MGGAADHQLAFAARRRGQFVPRWRLLLRQCAAYAGNPVYEGQCDDPCHPQTPPPLAFFARVRTIRAEAKCQTAEPIVKKRRITNGAGRPRREFKAGAVKRTRTSTGCPTSTSS